MMSLISDINNFFIKYGTIFNIETIDYTKQVVHEMMVSPTLKDFLKKNDITAQILLNEITPYCQFKLKKFGTIELNNKEIGVIFNIIIFSVEIQKMLEQNHASISSIGISGNLFYKIDKTASDYFKKKFNIKINPDEEFNFMILENHNDDNNDNNFNIGNAMN